MMANQSDGELDDVFPSHGSGTLPARHQKIKGILRRGGYHTVLQVAKAPDKALRALPEFSQIYLDTVRTEIPFLADDLTTEERLAEALRCLDECRALLNGVSAQTVDIATQDDCQQLVRKILRITRADSMIYLLARYDTLQKIAATVYKMQSEYSIVRVLREAADTIDQSRRTLDSSGFPDWGQIGGLDITPTKPIPERTYAQLRELRQDHRETNDEYARRVGLIVDGWDLLP